ncbi:hypothetical protein BRADI_5g00630v3 [Brachypodium distachyon]|uniref:ARID domain-containing protein n=1 Tax=Brachypodium distachyon TaxID=15368 RepID=A0A0Q3I5P9_BRADI|nr:hypothetical protein BRADI_5g00630v3 [Brachypodium distachyon]
MGSDADPLAILSKLQFLGFCADLNIPDAESADPSEVFDAVLAAFLREVYPGEREARPIPATLGDGRRVDLLRLFAAVRAGGGYASAASSTGAWAAATKSAGLDAAPAAPVKLLYAKYLGALDRWIQRLLEAQPPSGRTNQELSFDANGREDCNGRDQRHVVQKRKREDMVGMLGWVRGLAENVQEDGTVAAGFTYGYFSMVLAVREAVSRKRARRPSITNGTLLQEMGCKCCMSTNGARIDAQCSKKLIRHHGLDTNELTTVVENINGTSMVMEQERNPNGQKRNKVPVGSNYQAQVPQWTGVLPENYDDPETLKWLGTEVWPIEGENRKAPSFCDPIGRDEEEAKFRDVMQINASSSGRNLWNRLLSSFRLKRNKELVSYYFNCFLLRRRCYQNRITPKKIDSDDEEETEFRLLGNRLGQSATKYHSTKHTVCIQSTHCMDLDQ